ncbi:immunoglobulin I-set domain protein [Oesophagostomum dentatum]|uniref:Immunoglobulin I-set domain protein n=1 Tax=Oesophagostomum dentatum TaxID=61180 RepID=A0A0B1TUT3_OESDE|nr:immunoglobulin I-set domain protein [Oesophagostomum dentatum]
MSTRQEKEVNEGESASFRCDAVGNPPPTILWKRPGDDQVLAKGETITISNARNWQQGEYICTAVVDGFEHASQSHFLHIRGPPIITVPAELTANIGDTVEMPCLVSGRPKPLEVNWKKNGQELDYSSGKMQVHQIPRSYGVESRLVIRDLREIDMGVYNCTANNGIGYDAKATTLKAGGVADIFGKFPSITEFYYTRKRLRFLWPNILCPQKLSLIIWVVI